MTLTLALPNMAPDSRDLALSQFDTPRHLAERIVRWANVEPGTRVLEPSAGLGCIADEIIKAGAWCTCVEIDPIRCAYLEKQGRLVVHGDFLSVTVAPHDLAILNPPYEDDQDCIHVLRALHFAPRVVALVRLAFLSGKGRYERLWGKYRLTRLAILTDRPKFGGSSGSGKFDSCVVEIVRDRKLSGPVDVEWWG